MTLNLAEYRLYRYSSAYHRQKALYYGQTLAIISNYGKEADATKSCRLTYIRHVAEPPRLRPHYCFMHHGVTVMTTTHRNSSNDNAGVLLAAAAGFGLGLLASVGRKAAVQAITVTAGDWFEGLKREHQLAMGIIETLEKTTEEEPKKRAALLLSLQHALGKHAIQEEDVIYCALRASGDVIDADKLGQEHNAQVKQGLYDLEQIEKTSPAWLARLQQLKSDIAHHVREEEDVVYPRLREKLSPEENRKLTGRMNREGFKVA